MAAERNLLSKRRLRMAGIALGFLFLLWAPVEDTDLVFAQLLGAGITIWAALWRLSGKTFGSGLLVWGLTGLLTPPTTLVLMSFKSGLHAHGFPDFAPAQAAQVLQQTPYWTLGGLLVGSIWSMVQRRQNDNEKTHSLF